MWAFNLFPAECVSVSMFVSRCVWWTGVILIVLLGDLTFFGYPIPFKANKNLNWHTITLVPGHMLPQN